MSLGRNLPAIYQKEKGRSTAPAFIFLKAAKPMGSLNHQQEQQSHQ